MKLWELNDFVAHLSFFSCASCKVLYKVSLIFMSNLELALSCKRKNKNKKRKKKNKQRQTRTRGDRSYSEWVRAKWFCCAFKLGFLQIICKTSLIFKSNLKLAFSFVLKQRELYESKHIAVLRWSVYL